MTATVLRPQRLWVCPNCDLTDLTYEVRPHTRFHACKGLKGLTAPMVESGIKVKVTAVEREDYIGSEDVQLTEGRPIMSVVTEREDGTDVAVFAPTAHAEGESRGLDE